MIQRQLFNLATSVGVARGDTGPSMQGAIMQLRWYPDAADTGQDATLQVGIMSIAGDTGPGWLFYNASHNLGAQFTKAPMQPQHGADGAADPSDTGAAFGIPIVAAGDRLRAKIIPADTGVIVAGRLWIWTGD